MEGSSNKRIPYIDALKGFTILCVVLGHIGNGYMWDEGSSIAYFFLYNITNAFHMPLFMLLSGYVFQKAYLSGDSIKWNRLKKQVINLFIIYLVWSLILGLFKIVFGSFVNNPVSVTTLLLIPVKPLQLYWYLYLLPFYYMIFAFLRKLKINRYLILTVTFALCVLSNFIPALLIFDVRRFFCYLFFFYVGCMLQENEEFLYRDKRTLVFLLTTILFILAVVLSIVFWNRDVFLHDVFFISVVIGLGGSLGFFLLFREVRFLGSSSVFGYTGKHSLEIYLIHTFLITLVRSVFGRLGITSPGIHIAVCFIAGAGLPLLISFLAKKLKIYDVLFAPANLIKKFR